MSDDDEKMYIETEGKGYRDEHMEVHPSVELLLARMKSHPEHFYVHVYEEKTITSPAKMVNGSAVRPPSVVKKVKLTNSKWSTHATLINSARQHWNRKEKRLYNTALRELRLAEYHRDLMGMILTPS